MTRIRYTILVFLFIVTGNIAKAQIDTVFWFAAPWVTPDHHWRDPIAFHFSTFNNPTTIRLQQPVLGYDTTFTVPANSLFSKTIHHMMNTIESKPANTVLDYGFKITSSFPITVVYDVITRSPNFYNPETFSLKGQNGIGTEFVASFQTRWNNQTLGGDLNGDGTVTQPYQQINVVATEDNTVLYITPRCAIVGHPANVTFSVTLPLKGQVYTIQNLVQNTNVVGNNLAGTIIVASKPVAVTLADDSVNPAGGGGCFDLMGDQTVPVDVIGKDYIVLRGFLNAGSEESFFVTATENFTTVTINDGGVTTVVLNQGDTYRYQIAQPRTSVSADKNVYVLHMTGYGCELGKAILPPLNCSGSDIVTFPRTNPQNFSINILCPAGAQGGFLLNGSAALVPAGAFNVVPGTGGQWLAAQLTFTTAQIPSGSSNILTNSIDNFGMGIINGGTTTGCLYHYMSSFIRRVFVNAGNDQTLCTGSATVNLSGTVEGGATTGIWQVLNGSGTLATPTNLTTTYQPSVSDFAQGNVTFVLSSTGNCNPVHDTVRVNFIQSPTVDAGLGNTYCKNNISPIPISGSFLFAAGASWSGGNGGAFGNSGAASTTYTPSPADLAANSLTLYYTTAGSFFACPNAIDSVIINFTNPPVVSPGPNQTVCASTSAIPLTGSITGPTTTGIWSTTSSGAFSPSATNLTGNYLVNPSDTAAGSLYLVLTSTNNGSCNAVRDSILITFVDIPQVQITSQDTVCANTSTVNLSGIISLGFTPTWSTNGAGSIASPSNLNTVYTVNTADTAAGFIQVILSTNAGICPSQRDTMILVFSAPPVANAGPNQAYCNNELVLLTGIVTGATSTGVWSSTGTGLFNPGVNFLTTTYAPSALDVANGSVNLILTTTNNAGCNPDTDVMTITFKDAPVAEFTNTNDCVGQNLQFTDASVAAPNTITSWNWDFGDFTNSIASSPLHPYSASGTYTVTLIAGSSNGCFDTIQHPVTVHPLPIANFTATNPCEGTAVQFTDQSFISSGAVTQWQYNFGDGSPNATTQIASHVFPGTLTYVVTLQVTSAFGCVDTVMIPVNILPRPDAAYTATPNPVLAFEPVQFTDQTTSGTPIIDWFYNFGDSTGINLQNPVHAYANGGAYTTYLIATDQNGCRDTAYLEITVSLMPAVPTGFTPNGDGENDVFRVRGGPFEALLFRVYNNWGQLIYESTDQSEGWNGEFKGTDQPMGVYTWTVEVVIIGGKKIYLTGDVTLMR